MKKYKRNSKRKQKNKSIKKKGGNCGCDNDKKPKLFFGGNPSDYMIPVYKLRQGTYYDLNTHNNNPNNPHSIIDSRLVPQKSYRVGGRSKKNKNRKNNRTKKIRGGLSLTDTITKYTSDVFLGDPTSQNVITAIPNTVGSPFLSNLLTASPFKNTSDITIQPAAYRVPEKIYV